MGLRAVDLTKPYECTWRGYKFIGFRWALISQTPAIQRLSAIPSGRRLASKYFDADPICLPEGAALERKRIPYVKQ